MHQIRLHAKVTVQIGAEDHVISSNQDCNKGGKEFTIDFNTMKETTYDLVTGDVVKVILNGLIYR